MADFVACNWCGKVYRIKRGLITGLVKNRKYCGNKCKVEAEGNFRYVFLHRPHNVLRAILSLKEENAMKASEKKPERVDY